MNKVKVGVIGCGAISGAYLTHAKLYPEIIEVAACADVRKEAAQAKAQEFGIPKVLSVKELLKDPDIEIVLNLTIPAVHGKIAMDALKHGKHTYAEKPFELTAAKGKKIQALAQEKKLRTGCAPDTFFGTGQQTARKLLDEGAIGKPLAVVAFMLSHGVENWHPNPVFYYKPGGGPMMDMGPYYLTAFLNMFGPIDTVSGMADVMIPQRLITHINRKTGEKLPMYGQTIDVETPDHVVGNLKFRNGVIGTLVTSFATYHGQYDRKFPITVYGTEGTLRVPDPNGFDGEVMICKREDTEFKTVEHMHQKGFGRMAGVADMAIGIRTGRPHRASGNLALGVLEAMEGFLVSAKTGKAKKMTVDVERPAALPTWAAPGKLD